MGMRLSRVCTSHQIQTLICAVIQLCSAQNCQPLLAPGSPVQCTPDMACSSLEAGSGWQSHSPNPCRFGLVSSSLAMRDSCHKLARNCASPCCATCLLAAAWDQGTDCCWQTSSIAARQQKANTTGLDLQMAAAQPQCLHACWSRIHHAALPSAKWHMHQHTWWGYRVSCRPGTAWRDRTRSARQLPASLARARGPRRFMMFSRQSWGRSAKPVLQQQQQQQVALGSCG